MIVHARVAPKRDTTANWELHADFVPFRGEIIIYMDKYTFVDSEGNTKKVPAIKIGDGKTTVGVLPFLGGGGGSAPVSYNDLMDLPTINGKPLKGNITADDLAELGIQKAGDYPEVALTADDIDKIIDEIDGDDTDNS